jgi:DNA-binding CsgD family transcriptional regulator
LNLGRAKVIKMGHDLYAAESGFRYLSSNFKIKTPGDQYSEFLIQNYLFYTTIPYKTAFYLKVHTKIDWFKKFKRGYHYYDGNDLQNFRYPDEKLLSIGNIFSQREFEIIKLVESGFSTDLIAQTLFLSPYTVNTHRRNILKKSGKANTSDLILELKERGLL